MTDFLHALSHPFVESLGWSLLHFLWQGTILAAVTAIALLALKNASASLRYCAACITLAGMAVAPAITLCILTAANANSIVDATGDAVTDQSNDDAAELDGSLILPNAPSTKQPPPFGQRTDSMPRNVSSAGTMAEQSQQNQRGWLTALVAGWLLGVTALSLRLIFTLARVSRLRQNELSPTPDNLTSRVHEIARQLKVSRPVKLAQSALVEVPTVIGIIRPIILLPLNAITGLSTEQLDAILAHEIAHIRRHDYFVNLIQTVIETLLFYHPAVWWLSGQIRQERENCCDDIASDFCKNRISYANALVCMEELRSPTHSLAMTAASGNLTQRIRRLIGEPARESNHPNWWPGGLASLLVVCSVLITIWSTADDTTIADETSVRPELSVDANDEPGQKAVEPLTASSIADGMQASMRRFRKVDLSAESFYRDLTEIQSPVEPGTKLKRRGKFRYRSNDDVFLAEFSDAYLAEFSTDGQSRNKDWLEGFDGTTHFHTDDGLLILGEESLTGQSLSPLKLFFSLSGNADETLRLLRDSNAQIAGSENVDSVLCTVIEIERSRGDRSWLYRFCIAQDNSYLPLRIERLEKGKVTLSKTLAGVVQSGGVWYPQKIVTLRSGDSLREVRINELKTNPDLASSSFAPPIKLGTDVLDRRVGYGWHEDPWWNDLKPWLEDELNWPRPDLFEMHSMGHYGDCPLEGKPAPAIEPLEWLVPGPSGWDRPDRKLTLLYFYGGRLITPTPKWAAALNELHRRYQKYGFEVIGLAAATDTPELPRQAAKELRIQFPVGIDQASDTGYGKTFLAYGLESYHGMFFVDHRGLVRPCSHGDSSHVTVDGQEFMISHMESTVMDLLKKAGVENVKPQVFPDDVFDIATHNRVLKEWRRLREEAPKGATIQGQVTFDGIPVPAATVKLQPSMTIMSSNTGRGFMVFPDRAGTTTTPAGSDGTFAINDLPKGEYKLTCSARGLKEMSRTILIGADLPQVTVDVTLSQK